jgi:hypothetical protein
MSILFYFRVYVKKFLKMNLIGNRTLAQLRTALYNLCYLISVKSRFPSSGNEYEDRCGMQILRERMLSSVYESVSESFRTGRLEPELQMVQLSATRCNCIAILWVSVTNFVAITLYVASHRVFIVVSVISLSTQSGNFCINPRTSNWIQSVFVCVNLSYVRMYQTHTIDTHVQYFKKSDGSVIMVADRNDSMMLSPWTPGRLKNILSLMGSQWRGVLSHNLIN